MVKDSRFFLFQQACCLLCSSVFSTQTLCRLYCDYVQHLLCLHSCLDFVCHCFGSTFRVVCRARQPSTSHRCSCVLYFLPGLTPTVESMTAGTHSMLPPRATCNRDLEDRDSRQDSSFIENKVGRALLLVPTSNTIHRIHICPSADASSVAMGVVVHVGASPKLFVVFVIWARFHHWTYLISK